MNQQSKIGPTAAEKQTWSMNSSEYNNRYHSFTTNEKKLAKPEALRPVGNADTFTTKEKMVSSSSYEQDYNNVVQSLPERITRSKSPSSIAAPQGVKMHCSSTYKSTYDGKPNARPAQAIRPPPPQGLGWKGSCGRSKNSVNSTIYRPYTAHEVRCAKRTPIVIAPEYGTVDTNTDTRAPMDFNTNFKQDFVQHIGCVRQPPAPGAVKEPAHGIAGIAGADINAKMDLATTHNLSFNAKNAELAEQLRAVAPLAKDKSGKKPGWYKSIDSDEGGNEHEFFSTQTVSYVKHDGVRRPKSFQPVQLYNAPSTQFATDTLYKDAFNVWGNQRRPPMKPAARTKEDEVVKQVTDGKDGYNSEYSRIFKPAPSSFNRPNPIVPKTTNRTSGQFYGSTSYADNFSSIRGHTVARAPSFKPKTVSNPWHKNPESEQHFSSTTRQHYQGQFAAPANMCKPKFKQDQIKSERTVCFDTEYGDCFQNAMPARTPA